MALEMDITDKSGVNHSNAYYRVGLVNINYVTQTAEVTVMGYRDQTARNAHLSPVDIERLSITGNDFDSLFGIATISQADNNPVATAYAHLKTLTKFSTATDA